MTDPESPFGSPPDPEAVVEVLESYYEGHRLNTIRPNEAFCDVCTARIAVADRPRISMYFSDNARFGTESYEQYVHQTYPMTAIQTYCEDCTVPELLFPCEGYTEARLLFTIDSDFQMTDVDVTDISGRDDGIPWDPFSLIEEIKGVSFEEEARHQRQQQGGVVTGYGPEWVVTTILSLDSGIGIADLIKWDGSVNQDHLAYLRENFRELARQMIHADEPKTLTELLDETDRGSSPGGGESGPADGDGGASVAEKLGGEYEPDNDLNTLLQELGAVESQVTNEQTFELLDRREVDRQTVKFEYEGFEVTGTETYTPFGVLISYDGWLGLAAGLGLFMCKELGEPAQIYLDSAPPPTIHNDAYEDITFEWYTPAAVERGVPETRLEKREVYEEELVSLEQVEEWVRNWLSKPSGTGEN